jgi:hypothetical protein
MDRPARIVALILLMIFVAGTVVHEANATSTMSVVAMADGDMGNCDGCPLGDDGKASLCTQLCLAPFAAIPAAAGLQLLVMAFDIAAPPAEELVGRTGTPDPPPPRTIILYPASAADPACRHRRIMHGRILR